MKRTCEHVRNHPLPGDVIEITECCTDEVSGEQYEHEFMLRVVAVHEERVWMKEYGKGHSLVTKKEWTRRLGESLRSTLVRGADHDVEFNDYGDDPDTNSRTVEFHFVDDEMNKLELTTKQENEIIDQIVNVLDEPDWW